MAVLQIQALALLLPPLLAHATSSPKFSPISTLIASNSNNNFKQPSRRRRSHNNISALFLLPSSSDYRRCNSHVTKNKGNTIASTTTTIITATFQSNDESYCYVPPYGMVPRSTTNSAIVLNMSPMMGGVNGGVDYPDDRFRKKMNSKRTKDPVVQDFGSMRDWQASKTGLGRLGDDKVGDDRVSEMFGPGGGGGMMYEEEDRFDLMDRNRPPPMMERRSPPPPMGRNGNEEMMFEGDGGNFWVNPSNSMDRYPRGNNNEEMMARSRSRGGRRGRNRRQQKRSRNDDDGGEWYETRRRDQEYDDDEFDDMDYEYGVPPPTRSRSSFRSGAPPPPRPVKSFYDKLFWFGFDPDVTQPTDRTMFGGTRGKFNAMDMLRDREERQRRRGGGYGGDGGGGGGGGGGGPRRRTGKQPVIQDFGSVGDWNVQKQGGGRAGGATVGDDRERPYYGYEDSMGGNMGGPVPFPGDVPPMPPPGMPEYDFEPRFDEDFMSDDAAMDFEGPRTGRRRDRNGRRPSRETRRRNMDSRALEYDRFLAGGGGRGEYAMDDDYPTGSMAEGRPPSSRQRRGFAYKYNQNDLMDFDDGEFIDIEPKYATKGDLDMAARGETRPSSASGRRRRRSWEERAVEMDRVPPRGAVAWGPEGRIASGENPLDRAAMEALEDIQKSKRYLEKKERMVDDAKEEVLNLKSDVSFCENQLEESRGGRELEKLEQELGYIIRDVEDATRNLRLARAEMEDAANRVRDLEERNWALLSEYEAGRSFEE